MGFHSRHKYWWPSRWHRLWGSGRGLWWWRATSSFRVALVPTDKASADSNSLPSLQMCSWLARNQGQQVSDNTRSIRLELRSTSFMSPDWHSCWQSLHHFVRPNQWLFWRAIQARRVRRLVCGQKETQSRFMRVHRHLQGVSTWYAVHRYLRRQRGVLSQWCPRWLPLADCWIVKFEDSQVGVSDLTPSSWHLCFTEWRQRLLTSRHFTSPSQLQLVTFEPYMRLN